MISCRMGHIYCGGGSGASAIDYAAAEGMAVIACANDDRPRWRLSFLLPLFFCGLSRDCERESWASLPPSISSNVLLCALTMWTGLGSLSTKFWYQKGISFREPLGYTFGPVETWTLFECRNRSSVQAEMDVIEPRMRRVVVGLRCSLYVVRSTTIHHSVVAWWGRRRLHAAAAFTGGGGGAAWGRVGSE